MFYLLCDYCMLFVHIRVYALHTWGRDVYE